MAVEAGFLSETNKRKWQLLLAVIFFAQLSIAQCVTTFPYKQDFEANSTGWTTGGTASDWAWGTPNKSLINSAASGQKCWITGGLNKTSYNNGELAWLQSPCYDFTTIAHPYVAFMVFWETENLYDGAVLEYTINNGSTWLRAGSINDAKNCLNGNWYNTASVRYTNNGNGWSGSVQNGGCGAAGGSGKWVLANHTFPALAGRPNVRFRFLFGAGTSCNGYNGFAVDDFTVSEAPPNQADFSFSCTNGNTVNFTNASTGCPSYSWNFGDPASGAANTSNAANPSHTYSAAGTYTVSLTASGPDNAPSTITKTVTVLDLDVQIVASPNCKGDKNGSAVVSHSPSTASVTYSWNTSPVQNTATASNLGAGTYIVTVSGTGICQAQDNITITEPLPISNQLAITQPKCNGNDGAISITSSGGTAPYSYTWMPGVSTTSSATGLATGSYAIVVKDKNQCSITETAVLNTAFIIETNVLSKKDITCWGNKDGSILIGINGGTGPYDLSWSPYGGNQQTANNLGAGTYTLTIKDQAGCMVTASATIVEPARMALNIAKKDATCNNSNGMATATISGGVLPYAYSWAPGNYSTGNISNLAPHTYYLTVTDKNGCKVSDAITIGNASAGLGLQMTHTNLQCHGKNEGTASVTASGGTAPYTYTWSNGTTTNNITNVAAGTYSVVVKDAIGCSGTASVVVTEPPALTVQLQPTDALCNKGNGSISANATGGTSPYSYSWNNGATTSTINAAAGNYQLIVTDAKGCSVTDRAAISEPNALVGAVTITQPSCSVSGGSVSVQVNGGTSPYTYLWTPNNASTSTVSDLTAGNYSVKITDKNGCTTQQSAVINAFNSIIAQISKTDISCFGGANGTASIVVSGGQSPYNIQWNTGSTNNSISNLTAGNYSVRITDASNCVVNKTISIIEPQRISIQLTSKAANCESATGTVTSTVSGGTPSYSYSWQPAGSGPQLQNIVRGNYTLRVTDNNGCTESASAVVGSVSPLQINLGKDTSVCVKANDKIVLSPGNFRTYLWQDGSTASTQTVSNEGHYWVTVTDAQGCTAKDSIVISNDCGDIYFPTAFTPNGDGKNDLFGPLGNLSILKDFELVVFNRWGQRVFYSSNPFVKWNGRVGNDMIIGTYVWHARYSGPYGNNITQSGTVVLIH